jgi:hypothetical protein
LDTAAARGGGPRAKFVRGRHDEAALALGHLERQRKTEGMGHATARARAFFLGAHPR